MKHIGVIVLFIIALSLFFAATAGCKPRIHLPEDNSLTGGAKWLVISSLYCQMKAEPSAASMDRGLLRKGTVLKIEESRFSKAENEQGTIWFKVQTEGQSAWVSIRDAQTFSTEMQARNAARRME